MGPSKIPHAIKEKINKTVDAILAENETKTRFAKIGASPLSMSADKSAEFFQSELKKWGNLVRASGARVN